MKRIDLCITSHQTLNQHYIGSIVVSEYLELEDRKYFAYYCKFPFVMPEENCVQEIFFEEFTPKEVTKSELFYCCTFNRGVLTGLSISDSQTHHKVVLSIELEEKIKLEVKTLADTLKEVRPKGSGRPKMISSPDESISLPDIEVTGTINAEIEERDFYKIFKMQCCA